MITDEEVINYILDTNILNEGKFIESAKRNVLKLMLRTFNEKQIDSIIENLKDKLTSMAKTEEEEAEFTLRLSIEGKDIKEKRSMITSLLNKLPDNVKEKTNNKAYSVIKNEIDQANIDKVNNKYEEGTSANKQHKIGRFFKIFTSLIFLGPIVTIIYGILSSKLDETKAERTEKKLQKRINKRNIKLEDLTD